MPSSGELFARGSRSVHDLQCWAVLLVFGAIYLVMLYLRNKWNGKRG